MPGNLQLPYRLYILDFVNPVWKRRSIVSIVRKTHLQRELAFLQHSLIRCHTDPTRALTFRTEILDSCNYLTYWFRRLSVTTILMSSHTYDEERVKRVLEANTYFPGVNRKRPLLCQIFRHTFHDGKTHYFHSEGE